MPNNQLQFVEANENFLREILNEREKKLLEKEKKKKSIYQCYKP